MPPPGFSFAELTGWDVAVARCETEIVVDEHQDRAEQTWDFDQAWESEHMEVARALMHHVKAFDRVDAFVGKRRVGFFARRKLTQLMRESLARG